MKQHFSLETTRIESGFQAPEDFFAQNKANIMRQVVFEKPQKSHKFLWLKIAALFLVFFSVFILWNHKQDENNKQLHADIEDYLAMNRSSLYLFMEADLITHEALPSEVLSAEEIENYLILDQIDSIN